MMKKTERIQLLIEECESWLVDIKNYLKAGRIEDARQYRFAIEGARMAARHLLGDEKVEGRIADLSSRAFDLIEVSLANR